jgi:tetratricopeptide (TPR) repeat protein
MKHFFISYNSADRNWAEWIAWQLEEAGYTTVLQAWDFRPGSNFVLAMQQAAEEAEHTIAVLSPDYLRARFTQPEWAAAFRRDPTGEKGILLPVRVRKCDLEGLLPQIVYIDLVGLEETTAHDTLLAGVRRERAKPTAPPGFPGAIPRSVPQRPRFPGALPPIWNLPHLRNPNFTGREDILAQLRSALTSGQPAALTQAIHGLGGVGKTQLAVEYAYRHAAEYDLVWWVRAEEPAALAADYAALAQPLDLPQKDEPDQRLVVQAVRRWLSQNTGWLLIFDNARRPEDLRDYLPPGGAGHVLVTSRNPAWRGVANPLTVQVMERSESVAFLLKRTGQTDKAAADALAEALGDLPLALAQAGAYIETNRTTFAEYLELFQSRRTELWEDERPPLDYPHTVATTWSLAMEQIGQDAPAGADLLNLCAFLAPDDIPLTLLSEGGEHLPQPLSATVTDSLAMNKAVAALLQYSLIERTEDALSVHRMVQAVARDCLPGDARRTWAGAAVRLVNGAFPSSDTRDVQTWPQCVRLLSHALAATRYTEKLGVASETTAYLLNQAAGYLYGRAEFAGARSALERALAIDEAAFGPDHPNVASAVNNLGLVLKDLGDLEGARAHYERALAIWEKQLGPEHPQVAIGVNNLGGVLKDLGDLEGARAHYERALAIDEAAFGPHHPNVARDVNNLGEVMRQQGDLAGAGAALERALAIWEQSLGPEHPNVASAVNNLGMVLKDLGDLDGARAALERALAIDEVAFGPHHPKVARDVNNLGSVLRALGDLAGARAAFERVLGILEKMLPPEHLYLTTTTNNLGMVLKDLGDLAGARAALERALAVDEAAFGPHHPNVARDVNNLGGVLQALGDLAGARAHYEWALAIDEAAFGPHHPNVARDVNNLGGVLHDLGDLAGARAAYERALAIFEKALGPDHPSTVTVRNNLHSLNL